jgi:hypothetical protein
MKDKKTQVILRLINFLLLVDVIILIFVYLNVISVKINDFFDIYFNSLQYMLFQIVELVFFIFPIIFTVKILIIKQLVKFSDTYLSVRKKIMLYSIVLIYLIFFFRIGIFFFLRVVHDIH